MHSAIRWINSEPPAQREFGSALVGMMLEAGSSTRIKNKARLTPLQLVDPTNKALRDLIQQHEYESLNAGDFVSADEIKGGGSSGGGRGGNVLVGGGASHKEEDDDEAEFSGSDEEERAEFERRKKVR